MANCAPAGSPACLDLQARFQRLLFDSRAPPSQISDEVWISILMSAFSGVIAVGVMLATFYFIRRHRLRSLGARGGLTEALLRGEVRTLNCFTMPIAAQLPMWAGQLCSVALCSCGACALHALYNRSLMLGWNIWEQGLQSVCCKRLSF